MSDINMKTTLENMNSLAHRQAIMERSQEEMIQSQAVMHNTLKTLLESVQQLSVRETTTHATSPLTQSTINVKDPRISDVEKFSGMKTDFRRFERKIMEYLAAQPNTYRDDISRITYVSSRLSGAADTWYCNQAAFTSFDSFWDAFKEMYFDTHSKAVAERKFLDLKLKSNSGVLNHITSFETLALQSGREKTASVLFTSLTETLQMEVKKATWFDSTLMGDYNRLKNWLINQLPFNIESNQDRQVSFSSSLADPSDAMDISKISLTPGIKWSHHVPPEKYTKFKEFCNSFGMCHLCRELTSHNPACRLANKSESKAYTMSEGRLELFLSFPDSTLAVAALIDTGAAGRAFMRRDVAEKLGIPLHQRPGITLKSFAGVVTEVVSQETGNIDFAVGALQFKAVFLISDTLNSDIILGFKFLEENDLLVDCSLRRVVPREAWVRFTHNGSQDSTTISSINCSDFILPDFISEFREVFDISRCQSLPPYDATKAMDIELVAGADPLSSSHYYKLSQKEEEILRKEIQEGLESGKIERSTAFGACPVLFTKKPDGSLRLCIDYRRLNSITKPIQAILPRIDDILSSLAGENDSAKPLYSKIDLKGAFNLLRIKEGKEKLTSFVTKFGKFQYKVIPFGLRNAPGFFQESMVKIFHDLIGCGLWIYLDDLLIYERDVDRHKWLLKEILRRMRINNLIANPAKCIFLVEEVEFLGYTLKQDGLHMQKCKIQDIMDFPVPRNVRQLQSFLGICNYYRSFLPCFTEIQIPLLHLLKKTTKYEWNADCDKAFLLLKELFSTGIILELPARDKEFILFADASDFAIGAALHQMSGQTLRPVGFFSRKLLESESHYPVYDKELLAIKDALVHWRHLLVDTKLPVVIYSDHQNLTYFKVNQKLNHRQARWQEILADFNFRIQHIKGAQNVVADALSRRADLKQKFYRNGTLLPNEVFVQAIEEQAIPALPEAEHVSSNSQVEVNNEAGDDQQPLLLSEEVQALRNPPSTTLRTYPIFMFQYIRTSTIPESLPSHFKKRLRKERRHFAVHDGALYRKIRVNKQDMAIPYLLSVFRQDKMKETHEVLGHLGHKGTYKSLTARYWWPGMYTDYVNFCKECSVCQLNNNATRPFKHPMHPLPNPGIPFHTWHLDFIQDLPESTSGNKQILVAVDRTTRYTVATALSNRDTDSVLAFVHTLSTRFGVPYRVITDRGSCFIHEFHAYCQAQGIDHSKSSSYHPETNGLVERTIGTLKSVLRKMCAKEPPEKWDLFVDQAVFNVNARDHSSIGFTPFYLAHGVSPRIFSDDVPPRLFDYSNETDRHLFTARELDLLGQSRAAALFRANAAASKMKNSHDDAHATRSNRFKEGEFVKLIKKRLPSMMIPQLESRWKGPFIIHAVLPNDSYILKNTDGSLEPHPVNANHLAPYLTRANFSSSSSQHQISQISTNLLTFQVVSHRKLPSGQILKLWKGG